MKRTNFCFHDRRNCFIKEKRDRFNKELPQTIRTTITQG